MVLTMNAAAHTSVFTQGCASAGAPCVGVAVLADTESDVAVNEPATERVMVATVFTQCFHISWAGPVSGPVFTLDPSPLSSKGGCAPSVIDSDSASIVLV